MIFNVAFSCASSILCSRHTMEFILYTDKIIQMNEYGGRRLTLDMNNWTILMKYVHRSRILYLLFFDEWFVSFILFDFYCSFHELYISKKEVIHYWNRKTNVQILTQMYKFSQFLNVNNISVLPQALVELFEYVSLLL